MSDFEKKLNGVLVENWFRIRDLSDGSILAIMPFNPGKVAVPNMTVEVDQGEDLNTEMSYSPDADVLNTPDELKNWLTSMGEAPNQAPMGNEQVLVQVSLEFNGEPIEDIEDMVKALEGSEYSLDVEQTELNDNIEMVLMTYDQYEKIKDTTIVLPSGAHMSVEAP